jgi:hypothetical protein
MNMRTYIFTVLMACLIAATAAAGGSAELSPSEGEDGFSVVQAEEMELRWKVDGSEIDFVISAPTTGWVALGFDPTRAMKDAQMIYGFVQDGTVTISDQYGDGAFSHAADTALGGSNDVSFPKGTEENGRTTLHFSVPIDSGDEYDVPLTPGETHTVLFAFGPDGEDNFSTKHSFRISAELEL